MSEFAGIQRVAVIGAGTMGSQIGAVFALAGLETTIVDVSEDALARAEAEARSRISRLVEKGAIDEAAGTAAVGRLSWSSDTAAAAGAADFVLEAATESLDLKRRIFTQLGQAAPAHAILATNSSTVPSSWLAEASGRPDRLCNVHFFNPALVMKCVEIVPNPQTSEETIATVQELALRIGKRPVTLTKEVPGFIANRLMMAIQDEAVSLYEDGVASIEDIDAAAQLALSHPMGPFQLMDLVGLDVIELMHRATHDMTGDPATLPAASLVERTQAGDLGRKSGRGWYDYAPADSVAG